MKGIPRRQMVKVLSDDQVETIHEASLEILSRTGVRFDSEDARRRLLSVGALAHRDRKDVVTFPRSIVEEFIAKVPGTVKLPARDPHQDAVYDGSWTFPYAGGGDPKMVDLETGAVRHSIYSDVEMAARLGDALERNCFAASLVVPNDSPAELVDLRTMEAMVKNSSKAISLHATSAETVDYMVKIAECVLGDGVEFRSRPLFSLASSPSSPLTYAKHVCDVLIHSAEMGVPFSVVPCPITGETGPITLGGSMAMQNAEALAGLVLIQAVAEGLHSIYCGRVCFMDPKTGRDLWGVPEEGLVSAAMVQLARRYGMVADSCGMASDITRWDLQIGFERTITALLPVMAGTDSVSGIGSGWEGASSLELMVIDNEVYGDIERLMQGVSIDDDRLGLDVIDKVGHMGNFLAQAHTMDYLRKGELRMSSLWDKRSSERASKEGYKTLRDASKERVKRLLKEHEPMPLDRDVERDIDLVMRDAQKALAR